MGYTHYWNRPQVIDSTKYESVWFERCPDENEGDDWVSGFCKTSFRPYDLAVTAFLVIAKHHLGSQLQVQTDGEACH